MLVFEIDKGAGDVVSLIILSLLYSIYGKVGYNRSNIENNIYSLQNFR